MAQAHGQPINAVSGAFSSGPLNGNTFTFIGNKTNFFIVFDAYHDGDQDFLELGVASSKYFSSNGSQLTVATAPTGIPATLSPAVFRMIVADFDHEADMDILYQTSNAASTGISYLRKAVMEPTRQRMQPEGCSAVPIHLSEQLLFPGSPVLP